MNDQNNISLKENDKITKPFFLQRIRFIIEDRNLNTPSEAWSNLLFNHCSDTTKKQFSNGIEKLIKIPQAVWVKEYGFKGKPSLSDFVEILTGKALKTSECKKLEEKHRLNNRDHALSIIKYLLSDKNINHTCIRYFSENEGGISNFMIRYCNLSEPYTKEKILDAIKLMCDDMRDDEKIFKLKIFKIYDELHPPKYLKEYQELINEQQAKQLERPKFSISL